MRDIEGKISCGSVSVELKCDSSQLDVALEKMSRLMDMAGEAEQRGLNLGLLTAGVAVVAAPKRVSRRSLLGLGWWRRK